jgi:hypothetical protein
VSDSQFSCPYCGSGFKTEQGSKRHRCKRKAIAEDVGTASLRRSYALFDFWFMYGGFSKKPKSMLEFQRSPYFDVFVNLDRKATSIYLGSSLEYLRWLTDKRVPAKDWLKDSTIERYRDDIAKAEDAVKAVIRSLEVAARHCDSKGIPLSEFFGTITPGELSSALEVGKISPWLLVSTERLDDVLGRMDEPNMERLSMVFDADYWMKRVEINPEAAERATELVRSVGL